MPSNKWSSEEDLRLSILEEQIANVQKSAVKTNTRPKPKHQLLNK